ncbi:MAG: hypothetical protein K9M10_03075 [Candidatus Pacebacteria bacterium]|nr:hypothetical protein [Candidatus Paceibacterota bacterium]
MTVTEAVNVVSPGKLLALGRDVTGIAGLVSSRQAQILHGIDLGAAAGGLGKLEHLFHRVFPP